MPPKKDDVEITQADDPITSLVLEIKRRNEETMLRLDEIEKRVNNLDETWQRLIHVAGEQPLRHTTYSPQVVYQPPPWQQGPVQQPQFQSQPVIQSSAVKPKWEADEGKKEVPKKKKSNKLLIIIVGILLLIIIVAYALSKAGWTCALGGGA